MVVGVPSVGANHHEVEIHVQVRPLEGMVLSIEASVMRYWNGIPGVVTRMVDMWVSESRRRSGTMLSL
jgi:hypothetical protein